MESKRVLPQWFRLDLTPPSLKGFAFLEGHAISKHQYNFKQSDGPPDIFEKLKVGISRIQKEWLLITNQLGNWVAIVSLWSVGYCLIFGDFSYFAVDFFVCFIWACSELGFPKTRVISSRNPVFGILSSSKTGLGFCFSKLIVIPKVTLRKCPRNTPPFSLWKLWWSRCLESKQVLGCRCCCRADMHHCRWVPCHMTCRQFPPLDDLRALHKRWGSPWRNFALFF